MFIAFRADGACDWHSNLAIALGHRGAQHRLQFHHIFPKAVLKGSYTTREAHDIANLAFIGGKTNRQISAKPPSQYVPALLRQSGPAAFDPQCVPTEPALLGVEAYKEFLAARRHAISRRLNAFLGSAERSLATS